MTDELYTPAKPEDKPHAPPPDADTGAHTSRWIVVTWWLGYGIPFFLMVIAIAAWPHAALPIILIAAAAALVVFFATRRLCGPRNREC